MATQLPLDLPTRTALGREDFFVSPSNAAALATLDHWHDWPNGKLVLVGPKGSGKTHLAHVWAVSSGAQVLDAAKLEQADFAALTRGPLAIEDADRVAQIPLLEQALFHVHNMILAEGFPLLMTAAAPPARWAVALPDLKSRLEATAVTALDEPDDSLLAAMLTKQFADRQLMPSPDAVSYLVRNMERSAAEVGRIVALMDRRALSQGRKITRNLALEVLNDPDAL